MRSELLVELGLGKSAGFAAIRAAVAAQVSEDRIGLGVDQKVGEFPALGACGVRATGPKPLLQHHQPLLHRVDPRRCLADALPLWPFVQDGQNV